MLGVSGVYTYCIPDMYTLYTGYVNTNKHLDWECTHYAIMYDLYTLYNDL